MLKAGSNQNSGHEKINYNALSRNFVDNIKNKWWKKNYKKGDENTINKRAEKLDFESPCRFYAVTNVL